MKKYLKAGKIVSTHGIRGEVKVYPYCDSAEVLAGFECLFFDGGGKLPATISRAVTHKNMAVIKFDGFDSVDRAKQLIGKELYFDRADVTLPDGRFFVDDLIGLRVVDAGDLSIEYGVISDVTSNGAQDIYHVKRKSGDIRYFPAVREFLRETNIKERYVAVEPIPGMFD